MGGKTVRAHRFYEVKNAKFGQPVKITTCDRFRSFGGFSGMDDNLKTIIPINGKIYVLGRTVYHSYLILERMWVRFANWIPGILGQDYCACNFISNIYLLGCYHTLGRNELYNQIKKYCKGNWKPISHMNVVRQNAACAVFGGKIVVSGGTRWYNRVSVTLNTVEVYDRCTDEWSKMPS